MSDSLPFLLLRVISGIFYTPRFLINRGLAGLTSFERRVLDDIKACLADELRAVLESQLAEVNLVGRTREADDGYEVHFQKFRWPLVSSTRSRYFRCGAEEKLAELVYSRNGTVTRVEAWIVNGVFYGVEFSKRLARREEDRVELVTAKCGLGLSVANASKGDSAQMKWAVHGGFGEVR